MWPLVSSPPAIPAPLKLPNVGRGQLVDIKSHDRTAFAAKGADLLRWIIRQALGDGMHRVTLRVDFAAQRCTMHYSRRSDESWESWESWEMVAPPIDGSLSMMLAIAARCVIADTQTPTASLLIQDGKSLRTVLVHFLAAWEIALILDGRPP
jgi:hypothetical protein